MILWGWFRRNWRTRLIKVAASAITRAQRVIIRLPGSWPYPPGAASPDQPELRIRPRGHFRRVRYSSAIAVSEHAIRSVQTCWGGGRSRSTTPYPRMESPAEVGDGPDRPRTSRSRPGSGQTGEHRPRQSTSWAHAFHNLPRLRPARAISADLRWLRSRTCSSYWRAALEGGSHHAAMLDAVYLDGC